MIYLSYSSQSTSNNNSSPTPYFYKYDTLAPSIKITFSLIIYSFFSSAFTAFSTSFNSSILCSYALISSILCSSVLVGSLFNSSNFLSSITSSNLVSSILYFSYPFVSSIAPILCFSISESSILCSSAF